MKPKGRFHQTADSVSIEQTNARTSNSSNTGLLK